MLTSNKLKCVLVLRPDELLNVAIGDGRPRVVLQIKTGDGRTVSADIAMKSLRKAQTMVRELGAENVAVILQGSLTAADTIADAGLAATPKAKKEAVPEAVKPDGLSDLRQAAVAKSMFRSAGPTNDGI
jgi:hypothetical protein